MNQLARRKFLISRLPDSTPAILSFFGVRFVEATTRPNGKSRNRRNGERLKPFSFWERNRLNIDVIYRNFNKQRRKVLAELHPDRGGDAETFRRANALAKAVEKRMRKQGAMNQSLLEAA